MTSVSMRQKGNRREKPDGTIGDHLQVEWYRLMMTKVGIAYRLVCKIGWRKECTRTRKIRRDLRTIVAPMPCFYHRL